MSVRECKCHVISRGEMVCILVPDCLEQNFDLKDNDCEITCRVSKHFDDERNLVDEINELFDLSVVEPPKDITNRRMMLKLKETPLAVKYGVVSGDYVDIEFIKLIRNADGANEEVEIFPNRVLNI